MPALPPDVIPIFIAISAFLCVLTVALGLMSGGNAAKKSTLRQLSGIENRWSRKAESETEHRLDSAVEATSVEKVLHRFIPRRATVEERLERAGLGMGLTRYMLICLVLGVAAALIAMYLLKRPWPVAVASGIAVGVGFPHWLIGVLGQRRITKFLSLFPEAIDLIVRGLKSGLPIQESIGQVATEIPDPVGTEFLKVDQQVKIGRTMEDALWATTRRIDSPDFKFFVISLSVQRETGGNLAEALQNLADILRRRRQMRLKVRALSSEARASAYIIGSLPFIMFGILFLVNRGYVMQLFTDPRGLFMLGMGLTSQAIGVMVMFKMVRLEI